MPLYKITQGDNVRLVVAKTPQGAKNYVLKEIRDTIIASTATALEVATLVSDYGIRVEHALTEDAPVATDFVGDVGPAPIPEPDTPAEEPVPWEERHEVRADEALIAERTEERHAERHWLDDIGEKA